MSDLIEINRSLRDVQSRTAALDHKLSRLLEPPAERCLTARMAACAVRALLERRSVESLARELFVGDHRLVQAIERAAHAPAQTTVAGWAGAIVGEVTADLLANILPTSVLAQLRARSGNEFVYVDGAIVRVPMSNPTPVGAFTVEGGAIPVAELLLSSFSLPVRKCTSIVALTQELSNGAGSNVEQAFRILLEQNLGLVVDAVLLDASAASATRPAGLLNGLVGLTPAATGTTTDKIAADVKTLFTAINPAASPILIVSTVEGGVLDVAAPAMPKIVSVSVAAGTVIAVDAVSFVSSIGTINFDISQDPAVNLSDSPLAIGTPGTPATVAAPTQSFWQQDALGMRTILDCNWLLRRANAVSFMTGVGW